MFYITSLNFLVFITPGIAFEQTYTTIVIADSTIDMYNSGSNYGGADDLEVGYWVSWLESFIKFDLSEAPTTFHTAELRLEFIYVEATSLLEIYETSNAWNEYSITWNNAPASNGNLIISVSVAEDIIYVMDVTNDVEGISGEWSLRITTSDANWITLASRQCYSWYDPPAIIYYYTTSDLPIIIGVIAGVVIAAIIALVGGIIYNNYKKKKRQRPFTLPASAPSQPQQQPYRVVQKTETPRALEGSKFCPNCGSTSSQEALFCTVCGTKFPSIKKL